MHQSNFLKNVRLIICFLLCLFMVTSCSATTWRGTVDYDLDITFDDNLDLSSNGILLFQADNVDPGDYFLTNITVTNHTDMNIQFFLDDILVDKTSFRGAMLYQISNQNGDIIYNADSNFARELATLAPREVRVFQLKSLMKEETKNIIQGETAQISFIFRVYSVEEDIPVPDTGGNFITMATSHETCLVMGILLIITLIIYIMHRYASRKQHSHKTKKPKKKKKSLPSKSQSKKKSSQHTLQNNPKNRRKKK